MWWTTGALELSKTAAYPSSALPYLLMFRCVRRSLGDLLAPPPENILYVYFIRVYIYSFPGNKSPLLKLLRFARDIFLSLVSAFISPLPSVWRCSHLDSQTATDTSRAHVMLRGRGHHTGSHKTVCHLFLVLTVANGQNPYICRTHQENITAMLCLFAKHFWNQFKNCGSLNRLLWDIITLWDKTLEPITLCVCNSYCPANDSLDLQLTPLHGAHVGVWPLYKVRPGDKVSNPKQRT